VPSLSYSRKWVRKLATGLRAALVDDRLSPASPTGDSTKWTQCLRARVRKSGHDIPEADIRRRSEHSRLNLVHLLPTLTALRVYDNSAEADPDSGDAPTPWLVLHMARGTIVGPADLSQTPAWAKPIVAAALKLHSS